MCNIIDKVENADSSLQCLKKGRIIHKLIIILYNFIQYVF